MPTSSSLHGLAEAVVIWGSSRRHSGQVAWPPLSRNSLSHQPAMQSPWNLNTVSLKIIRSQLLDGGCPNIEGASPYRDDIAHPKWVVPSLGVDTLGSWPVIWFGSSNRPIGNPNYNLKSGIQKRMRSGSTMSYIPYSIDKLHSKHYLISRKGSIDEWSLA